MNTVFTFALTFLISCGAMAQGSSYLLIQKDGANQTFPVSKCQISEQASTVDCQPLRTLTDNDVLRIKSQLSKVIQKQNVETSAIVVGGVVVGIAAGAVGGFYIGAPVGIAIASAMSGVSGLGMSGVVEGTFWGWVVSTTAGAAGAGASSYFAGKSITQVIFRNHAAYMLLENKFQRLLDAGSPVAIYSTESLSAFMAKQVD